MPRFPDIDPTTMSEDQRRVHDAIASGPRGSVRGPLKVWLQRPALAERAQELGTYCRFNSSLEPRLSELAIILVGRFWKAAYEWNAHAPIAAQAGISDAVIEAIRADDRPRFDNADEEAVYDFTMALNHTHRVPDEVYARAVSLLGLDGVVDLVAINGYYTLISMTLQAFEVPLPDGVPSAFADGGD